MEQSIWGAIFAALLLISGFSLVICIMLWDHVKILRAQVRDVFPMLQQIVKTSVHTNSDMKKLVEALGGHDDEKKS